MLSPTAHSTAPSWVRRARAGVLATALTVAVVGAGAAALPASAAPGLVAETDGLPGPCIELPGAPKPCPTATELPPNNTNTAIQFNDAAISTFVGGDLTVTAGVEAEGRFVVLGDALFSSAYDVGVVGVGSRVPPPPGVDALLVGGNMTVTVGLNVGGYDGAPGHPGFVDYAYRVAHQGTLTGTVSSGAVGGVDVRQESGITTAYAPALANLIATSQDLAALPDTGSIDTVSGPYATLIGDGTSAVQVFTYPSGGAGTTLDFVGIPPGATIVINVPGASTATINVPDFKDSTTRLGDLASRILWNVPDATTVSVTGGQVPGSIIVGNPASTTTHTAAGTNGRVFVAGNLIHNRGGSEFHSYPFFGDIPVGGQQPPLPGQADLTIEVDLDIVGSCVPEPAPSVVTYQVNGGVDRQGTTTGSTLQVPGLLAGDVVTVTAVTGGVAGGTTVNYQLPTAVTLVTGSNTVTVQGAVECAPTVPPVPPVPPVPSSTAVSFQLQVAPTCAAPQGPLTVVYTVNGVRQPAVTVDAQAALNVDGLSTGDVVDVVSASSASSGCAVTLPGPVTLTAGGNTVVLLAAGPVVTPPGSSQPVPAASAAASAEAAAAGLARTGAEATAVGGIAAILVAAGAMVLAAARHRRTVSAGRDE